MGDDFDLPLPEPPKTFKLGESLKGLRQAFGKKRGIGSGTSSSTNVNKHLKELEKREAEFESLKDKLEEKERILDQVEEKIQKEQKLLQVKEAELQKRQDIIDKKTGTLKEKVDKFSGMLTDLEDEVKIKQKIIDDLEENIRLKKQYLASDDISDELRSFMKLVDNLLGDLPKEKIQSLVRTKDFKFYEKMMKLHGIGGKE